MRRPQGDEFDEYYSTYIDRVPGTNVIEVLERGLSEMTALLEALGDERGEYRYAEGKWTVKEVVGHVVDGERTFAQRGLAFARRDPEPLPSFDQDIYVANGAFEKRSVSSLTSEFAAVRAATLALFEGFDEEVWDRRGFASGCEFSVRSIPFIIAGHEMHHRAVLNERYR